MSHGGAISYGRPVTHRQRPATSNAADELGPTRNPTNAHRAARTQQTRQARPRALHLPPPPTPPAPWTRHKQPASMGSSAEAVLTPSARVVSHFFEIGEKCEKNRTHAHPEFQNHELDRQEEEDELCPGRKS